MKITVGQYQEALRLIKRYKRQLKDEAKEVNVIEVINNHKESEIIKKYIKEICKYYGFGLTDFISKRRYGNYIKGKQLLCYLLKEYDSKVFKEEVVSEFVLLHRTTVIYHVNTVKNYIESKDKETLKAIGTIKYNLNGQLQK